MKKKYLLAAVALSITSLIFSQQPKGITGLDNWMNNWTEFKPSLVEYHETTHILTGIIDKNTLLKREHTYLLVGVVYVTNNANLTIEPGTVIRGDEKTCGTLVITKGAKILAEGLSTAPIIFTSNAGSMSRRPGNWGGIIVLGNAPINKIGGVGFLDFNLNPALSLYGGTNPQDNSGVLSYIRIEYAGRKLNELKELNGLSLAGVGRDTKINHVQISYSNDDSFECYGGDVAFDNLISFRTTDDDFDFTQGAQCTIFNSIAIRYPYSSDAAGSRCFEIDSYSKIEDADATKKITTIVASNITCVNMEKNEQGLVREAVYVKKDSNLSINNSVISGFAPFILFDKKITTTPENLSRITFRDVLINDCKGNFESEDTLFNQQLNNWYLNNGIIEYQNLKVNELLVEPNVKSNPDFRYKLSSFATN